MPERGKVLVTGANGFVGSVLCPALEHSGSRVVRMMGRGRAWPGAGRVADTVHREIGAGTRWDDILEGVTAVVHLAARTHLRGETASDAQAYRAINVDGTASLVRAAADAGVGLFVFVSSIKVNGESTTRPYTEDDTPDPQDHYGESKREAEVLVRSVSAQSRMASCILRPPLMYGAGVKGNMLGLIRAIHAGVPLPLGSVDNRRSVLYVGNLVSAILACLGNPRAGGRTFLLSDGAAVSTPDLVRCIARAMQRPARLLRCPPAVLRAAGALLGKREQVARLTGSLEVDSSSIRRTLAWEPPFSLDQGMAEAAAWFQSQPGSGA